jgi:hypothetical protein
MRHADPHAPPPERGHIDRHWPDIHRATIDAIRAANDGEGVISPVDLREALTFDRAKARDLIEAGGNAGQAALVSPAAFPHVLARLIRERVVALDRTPGRVRVHAFAGQDRTKPDPYGLHLGRLAIGALDVLDCEEAAPEASAHARRRMIDAAAAMLATGLPPDEIADTVRRLYAPDLAGLILAVVGQALEAGYSAPSPGSKALAAVMRQVVATGRTGALEAHVIRDLASTHGREVVRALVALLVSEGRLVRRLASTPIGGRPGWRLFSEG